MTCIQCCPLEEIMRKFNTDLSPFSEEFSGSSVYSYENYYTFKDYLFHCKYRLLPVLSISSPEL